MSDDYVVGGGQDHDDPMYMAGGTDGAARFQQWLHAGYQEESEIPIPIPETMSVHREAGALTISRRWFGGAIIFMTIFALFWNGFLAIWFGIAISQGIGIMAAFGSIHALVGIGMVYYVIAGYRNRTHIRVNPQTISIEHEPMPWFGAKSISSQGIQQLYSKRRVSSSRSSSGRSRTSVSYEVRVIDGHGRDISLIRGLQDDNQALFIEQAIEKHLGIPNRPVRGEMR